MFKDIGRAIMAWKAWNRLKEAQMKGKLLTAALGLGGAILTGIVAKFSSQCPDLFSNLGAILTAGLGAGFMYWKTRQTAGNSVLIGFAAAAVAGAGAHITLLCGPDFFTVAPTLVTAGAIVGVAAWLKSPHE